MSDVPTLVEAGYMNAGYDTLFGVVAPAGTPAAAIAKLNGAINEGLRSEAMRANFEKLGIEPEITTPQEFAAIIAQEIPKWAEVVRLTGVKVEQ
jgi:tripartite-type tricarboxylate transporter receptor subunit TctC